MTRLWEANDLARVFGFRSATPAFWRFCRKKGLEPLADKPMAFDADKIASKVNQILRGC